MITIYSGSVGSGKSYHALELGLEWVTKRKHVIANFPVLPPKKFFGKMHERVWEARMSRWHFEDEITPELLMARSFENGWFGKESQCLVVIDESGIVFNSRDWQSASKERVKWIKFLSQSRKFGYDFILVAQSDRMIDKQIRGLVEYEVKHLKANNSFFLSWLGMFRLTAFLYVYRWYQTKLRGSLRMAVYKPWIGARYDTMRTFNLDELLEAIEKIYEGKVIPAPVAVQLDAWRERLEERRREKQEQAI